MRKRRLKNPIYLFYALVAYVLLQFAWWLYLIFSLYSDIYIDEDMLQKKLLMLGGEGAVFLMILMLGVLVIRRAFMKEKELNQRHENFLMSVSHELKTPISSVKLFLQTLTKRDLEEEKRKDIYNRSLKEVNRLNTLVGNILLTKNISNDNFQLNMQHSSLDEFILEIINPLKSTLLVDRNLDLDLNPTKMDFDKEAITSVVTNLIENAVKYSPAKSNIAVTLQDGKDTIVLKVIDEGPGIESKQVDKVFSIFYRVDNEITRQSKGTGLGLYITKSLVEAHKGRISLKNNNPQGLIAEITFNK